MGGRGKASAWRPVLLAGLCALATIGAWGAQNAAAAQPALTWSAPVSVDTPTEVKGISCPSTSLCVAVDNHGNVITSTDPTGGAAAWTVTELTHEKAGLLSISCPSASLCVALDSGGDVWTSTDPTGGVTQWSSTNITEGGGVGAQAKVACASASLCVIAPDRRIKTIKMVQPEADVFVSTAPTNAASWKDTIGLDGTTNSIDGVDCESASLCVALDDGGRVLSTTTPTGEAGAWHAEAVDEPNTLYAVSCPSALLCVAGDVAGDLVTSSNPTGIGAWNVAHVDGGNALFGVSCPSVALCVAVDDQGNVLESVEPLGGAGVWSTTKLEGGGGFLEAVSCPSETLCAATDASGDVRVGTPAGTHLLTVSLAGSGSGAVTGTALSCPPTCSHAYASGTKVTLTGTPGAGSAFAGWSGGGCSGSGTCSVTLDADRNVTATFTSTGGTGGSGGTGAGAGGAAGGGSGGASNGHAGSGGSPLPRLTLGTAHPGSPLVFSGAGTSAGGSTIAGYRLRLSSTPGEVECGPSSPIATVSFAGPTAGTATLTVLTTAGGSASTSIPYSTAGPLLRKGARPAANTLPSKMALVAATCAPAPGTPPKSLSVGGRPVNPACEVHAGLVDAVGCGLHQVELCSGIPFAERRLLEGHQDPLSGCLVGSLKEAYAFGASARRAHASSLVRPFAGVPLVDAYYVSTEPVRVNGLDVVPRPGAAIVIAVGGLYSTRFTTKNAAYLVSSGADVELGNLPLQLGSALNYSVGGGATSAHVADFNLKHPLPFLPEFSDLPLVGTLSADLVKGGATELSANVQLPEVFSDDEGNGLTTSLALRTDNANGLYLDSFHLSIPNADLGEVGIENAKLDYSRQAGTLEGQASVVLPSGDTATAAIGFLKGSFDKFSFDYAFGPGEGIEVFDGIYLTELFGGLTLNPTELEGGSRVSIGPSVTKQGCGTVDVRGKLTVHFGPTPFSIGGTGENELLCQNVGTRSFHVDSDGHAEVGESVGFEIPSPETGNHPPLAKVKGEGQLQAYVDTKSRQFHFQFDGIEQATLNVFGLNGSYEAELVVSDLGFGLCANVEGPFKTSWHPGFGEDFAKVNPLVLVAPAPVALPLLVQNLSFEASSCNIAQYRTLPASAASARAGRARAAAATFGIAAGERTAILLLRGAGGAPLVTLHGPGGRVIDATHLAPAVGADELVLHAPSEDLTEIQIRGHDAGAWTIEPAPGSPAITSAALSHELPPPSITAHVGGHALRRVLSYRANVPLGTRITFLEQGNGGSTLIGSTNRSRGTIAFTPSTARTGPRTIIAALLSPTGTPEPSLKVTTYSASPPRPGRPGAVRVQRTRAALLIRFAPAVGAAEHFVTVRLSDGRRLMFVLKGARHTLVVRGVTSLVRVLAVRVRGEGFGALGPASHA